MFAYIRKIQLRRTLYESDADTLAELQEFYCAGFRRGSADIYADTSTNDWIAAVSQTTLCLARDHSSAQAGSWLAGAINARLHVCDGNELDETALAELFHEALSAGEIEQYATFAVQPVLGRERCPAKLIARLNDTFLPV